MRVSSMMRGAAPGMVGDTTHLLQVEWQVSVALYNSGHLAYGIYQRWMTQLCKTFADIISYLRKHQRSFPPTFYTIAPFYFSPLHTIIMYRKSAATLPKGLRTMICRPVSIYETPPLEDVSHLTLQVSAPVHCLGWPPVEPDASPVAIAFNNPTLPLRERLSEHFHG